MDTKKPTFWERVATFIVDKRNIFFLFFIAAGIFCAIASGWGQTNSDLTDSLPADTETRQGLTLMEEEFTTYATAQVMVDNITLDRALALQKELEAVEGVTSVDFYDPNQEAACLEDYYRGAAALFSVTFYGETGDDICNTAMEEIRERLSGYDTYISSEVGSTINDTIGGEMKIVMLVAVVIILLVLLFTSKTYMEIPVLMLTFGMAALLNMGTNYLLGEISFITKSIAVVLQLALAIDYAIILCHRFTEEREHQEAREACIAALSKSIPEIAGSSLTTISGLVAMTFMQFRIGYDMGIVLIKAIFFSLLSVFTLMPGLLMLFSRGMDRTQHKSFVPRITGWGKLVVKSRYIIPPVFLVLLAVSFLLSNKCPYVYGYSTLTTFKQSDNQIAEQKIKDTFGSTNLMAMLVPAGDYEKEQALLADLEREPQVERVMGLGNIEAVDGYMLTDALTPRQLAETLDMDYEVVKLLYGAYAADQEDYGRIINDLDQYSIPLIDMVFFLYDQKEAGYISLDEDMAEQLDDMHSQLTDARAQLAGPHYSRLLVYLDLPEESQETFDYLDTLHRIGERYYDHVYLVGDSTSDHDLASSFEGDNVLISILSALFVIMVLIFTFRSAGLPVLLILVIQGSIWINFSFPYLLHKNLFFMSYLIVSSIQMGANIDYAIVISSRYMELKQRMSCREAIVEALNLAFPTIVTSGTILASAGTLICFLTSEAAITAIGECLGRGTLISMLLVMGVLPQILLLGDTIIEKTAFALKVPLPPRTERQGSMVVRGRVRGYVNGMVDAEMNGVIHGTLSAVVDVGALQENTEEVVPDEKNQ